MPYPRDRHRGKARDYARKISPFNLTAPAYLNGGNEPYAKVDVKQEGL